MNAANVFEAIKETKAAAKESGELVYLRYIDGEFVTSNEWVDGWFFRAYPGGRMELTAEGSKLVNRLRRGVDDSQIGKSAEVD